MYTSGDMFGLFSFLINSHPHSLFSSGIVDGNYTVETDEARVLVIDKDFIVAAIATSSKFASLFYKQMLSIFTRRIEEDLPLIKDNFISDKKQKETKMLKPPRNPASRKLNRSKSIKNLEFLMAEEAINKQSRNIGSAEFRNSLEWNFDSNEK